MADGGEAPHTGAEGVIEQNKQKRRRLAVNSRKYRVSDDVSASTINTEARQQQSATAEQQ